MFPDYYENTIYTSGNPQTYGLQEWKGKDHFFNVDSVWDYGWKDIDGIPTTPPSEVSKAIIRNSKKHKNKRFVAHFLQPHAPYVGDVKLSVESVAPTMRKKIKNPLIKFLQINHVRKLITTLKNSSPYIRKILNETGHKIDDFLLKLTEKKQGQVASTMSEALRKELVSPSKIKRAYRGNLKMVLEEVSNLIQESKRKNIVITADHGELFRWPFGHQSGLAYEEYPELYHVPWLEVENED
ncbi:hypothetical protein C9439_03830 [archaeon SCG-AAA382B04]|nr:hypothetical protein C9439_03830 [archaeon SCG-AAA382B04]